MIIACVIGAEGIFLIVPEDVPMALIGIYGFSPPLRVGKDHRVGFGFKFGSHADFQVMYEFGPQMRTKPLQPIKIRSAAYRQRVTRRRPLLELLLRAGLLQVAEAEAEVTYDEDLDQPR
ncbi:uncharacterized protein LOC134677774 [Cydia fagiglandana]|uniref:uncharacterized protein LOC134677774 n=1 Tax=Cydia fagiglandana TaxID=1458189 RepID=UPI002FEE01D2